MHLDTVFTQIDVDKFTYHPGIMDTLQVFEITEGDIPDSDEDLNVVEVKGSLEEILEKYLGRKIELIPCAGGEKISAEREQNDTLEVLMVEPGQYPRVERIGSDLASLQKAVDGYIEAVYPYDDPVALICGEEAKLEGKPLNRALRDEDGDIYDIVAGKFFLCGLGDENFASLPKELQQKYEEKLRQPEAFLKMGSKIMAIPTEPAKAAGKGKTAPVTER